jgi:hypothetical protein
MINSGLGFQLAKTNVIVSARWYIWSYVLLDVFVSIWYGLVLYDEFKMHRPKPITDGRARGRVNDIGRQCHVKEPCQELFYGQEAIRVYFLAEWTLRPRRSQSRKSCLFNDLGTLLLRSHSRLLHFSQIGGAPLLVLL